MTRVFALRPLRPLALVLVPGALAVASPRDVPAPEGEPRQRAEPTVLNLSVEEAVSLALQSSPRLDRLGALQAAAEAARRGAEAGRWPQVDVGGGYQRHSNVPELQIAQPSPDPDVPGQLVTIYPNIPDNWRLRAGLTWPVYTGGQVGGRIDAAAQGHVAAGHDREAARNDLILDVKHSYWSLASAREGVRVFADAIRAFEAHLEDARNLERFGMAAPNEVLAIQVQRDRAELNRLEAETAADMAEADLRRLIGVPSHMRLEATEPLEAPPFPPPDVEVLVAEAAEARPDRAALVARIAAADALVRVEGGARLPQVAVTGGYLYANPNREIVPPEEAWRDTWDIGVSVSWSVFDGGRRSSAQARARAEAEAARQQLREVDRAIRLEVTRRALELRTAEKRLHVSERAVESARENVRVTADRYREGLIPSSELLDAEVDLERAEFSRTEALAALRLAAAGLDRAVGR
jgi:outer membrane protein TolC